MIKIQIDGKTYEVQAGANLLETIISLGLDLPYFCYHPAMGSVGACRQCAVIKYAGAEDKKGKIIMSCMEPVSDQMIVSIEEPEARNFRKGVIEGLMTNHPHDCPVCDEGGECHLQDMTVMTGHNYRRFPFRKRTFTSQNLGPFIHHEMNRCIQCYRCVRFYRDIAGGKDLNVFGSGNHLYFGRQKEGMLESEFSGNLVEVCPTGVFTDKTLKKHFTRKWDLTSTPSVCVHCSVGCNTLVSERYGSVRRILNRYNADVNGYFLCDRGRFGYEFINSPLRIKKILGTKDISGNREDTRNIWESAGLPPVGEGRILGIGSPRASLESNFALMEFVGKEHFYHGIPSTEYQMIKNALNIIRSGNAKVPSLKEIEKCDAFFVMGEDVSQTAPLLALSLRQAARNKALRISEKMGIPKWNDTAVREVAQHIKSPLYIASMSGTKLDDIAIETWHNVPDNIARLGFAVAHAIFPESPAVENADTTLMDLAKRIADDLLSAQNPLIVTGVNTANEAILNALSNISSALLKRQKTPNISIVFPESNSFGLGLMDGEPLEAAFERIKTKGADALIIIENDIYRRFPKEPIDDTLKKCGKIIILDHLMHATSKKADIVIPVATYAESAGTVVNFEGRAQRYYPVLHAEYPVRETWKWIADLQKMSNAQAEETYESFDELVTAMVGLYPDLLPVKEDLPNTTFRYFGDKIARQTMRFSGRTAITANRSVSEPEPQEDPDSPMNYSMEGYKGKPPSDLVPYFWSPGWNSQQAVNKYLEKPGGSYHDKNPGIRLFERNRFPLPEFIHTIPEEFNPAGDLLFFPVYRIFGSEELSSIAHTISGTIDKPFIVLHPEDARKLQPDLDQLYKAVINEVTVYVNIRTDNNIPLGIAGFSSLFPAAPYIELPAKGSILFEVPEKDKNI